MYHSVSVPISRRQFKSLFVNDSMASDFCVMASVVSKIVGKFMHTNQQIHIYKLVISRMKVSKRQLAHFVV